MFRVFHDIYVTGRPGTLTDYEIIRKDNSRKYIELSASLVHDEQGSAVGFHGIARDITDRKRAENVYRTVADKSFAGVYIIQDGAFKYINANAAAYAGYTAEELIGRKTMTIVHPDDRQQIRDDAKSMLRGMRTSPYEFRMITRTGGFRWIIETVTPISYEGRQAFLGSCMDITDRKRTEKALEESFKSLRKALGATIQAMAVAVESRDPYTAGHQRRVADLARSIATKMGLSKDQIEGIRMAGMIHDLGKISVPADILNRPAGLTRIEFDIIKMHAQAGYEILKDIEFPWPIARMVLEHHERLDGSGYPHGLKGDDILPESKILSVADVVEAMASHRPYRPSYGIEKALEEISGNRDILYDAAVADTCIYLFRKDNYAFDKPYFA